MVPRVIESRDLDRVRGHARADFAAVAKDVKAGLKGPLADKQPIHALHFRRIGRVDNQLVVEDAKGERLVMTDTGMTEEPASTHLMGLLPSELLENKVLIARFRHDLDRRKLQVKPLSIIAENSVVRLTL